MSPETTPTKLCPTCGTRLAENATRCVVCGSEFSPTPKNKAKTERAVQGTRMPEIRLSLPAALGLLALILAVGAAIVFIGLRATNRVVVPTPIPSATNTPPPSQTPTETPIPTDTPTITPLPPLEYSVKSGDYCATIANAFHVSVQSIILMNSLSATCTDLRVGQVLKIPQPTPTPLPAATSTLESGAATLAACQTVAYTVQSNDTLSSISANYNVPMDAIKQWNGLTNDNVFLGVTLNIPLCMRAATPGPSPTPTTPPPYPAPNLLLPADGAPFTLANDTVTLQWASVGTLRENERYQVTVLDVTAGTGRPLIDYMTDTKFIVPVTFRPQDNQSHIIRWWVVVVRQTGTDDQGNPIWSIAGTSSERRAFTWSGAAPVATPTP
jgi:LysM repeat protein